MTTISIAKLNALTQRMVELEIDDSQLSERFIKGSGSGGQKINKTASCVYLLHKPSGIEIKCQRSRSQSANRFFARRELCDRLELLRLGADSPQQQAIDKVRKQKQRRRRRSAGKT
ncbi:MAG: peptide chain release factor-like protein [Gammaproteobacteria bacterium]|nr:MAG: peptide chain release factor-like protein [Gammaproteobacteria bacterium]